MMPSTADEACTLDALLCPPVVLATLTGMQAERTTPRPEADRPAIVCPARRANLVELASPLRNFAQWATTAPWGLQRPDHAQQEHSGMQISRQHFAWKDAGGL